MISAPSPVFYVPVDGPDAWEFDRVTSEWSLNDDVLTGLKSLDDQTRPSLLVPYLRDGEFEFVRTELEAVEGDGPTYRITDPSLRARADLQTTRRGTLVVSQQQKRVPSGLFGCLAKPGAAPETLPRSVDAVSGHLIYTVRVQCLLTSSFVAAAQRLDHPSLSSLDPSASARQVAVEVLELIGRELKPLFLRELGVNLELLPTLVYPQPQADPFRGHPLDDQLFELVAEKVSEAGVADYDLAHVLFNGAAGGSASVAVVRDPLHAHEGATSAELRQFDEFTVEYFAHELGHQLGAHHTFAGRAGACGSQRHDRSAYELGNGGTIMGYSGFCGPDMAHSRGLFCFHARSAEEIRAHLHATLGDESRVVAGDGPRVNGSSLEYLPVQTPFMVRARVEAPSGVRTDVTIEQWDLAGDGGKGVAEPDRGVGPLFRCEAPVDFYPLSGTQSASVERRVPDLGTLTHGPYDALLFDQYPMRARSMRVRLRARDSVGRSAEADVAYEFVDSAGPFRIESVEVEDGGLLQVKWDRSGTHLPPVSEQRVVLELYFVSTAAWQDGRRGGERIQLTEAIANDGSAAVLLPSFEGDMLGWIIVRGALRPFFAVSNEPIELWASQLSAHLDEGLLRNVQSEFELPPDFDFLAGDRIEFPSLSAGRVAERRLFDGSVDPIQKAYRQQL